MKFVELLRSNDVAVRASPEQRSTESEAEPARFIDHMNRKAFAQSRFDPEQKLRGSKTSRWARRRMVLLSHHHQFIPMNVKPELEQRATPVYLQSSRRRCGGHTRKTVYFFHKAGESTKTHPRLYMPSKRWSGPARKRPASCERPWAQAAHRWVVRGAGSIR
jgi:hypothetical protein